MAADKTLYDKLGGKDQITTVVDDFYDRVLSDDSLTGFFEGMDMTAQKAHMIQFLSSVAGGPVEYSGDDMREAHEHLDLEQKHFDAVAEHLEAALREFGVPDPQIDAVLSEVVALEDDVLCR